ncbi:nucleotidyltransferase family protein [Paenibacillus hexagrammi]|uniref:Nucleotidyltransferase family protein n=1 Tax=Paenibacillus hexagrammi TaxID=2908839 RepID=A0ABY3SLZ6_9BACL|nr:nucleotidyltransferase family protein [Paenibacillus sp. YPD9-1]UJF34498.1 nucleotidyltransferase family protein [Paenibacillus sp. YPD9-1]
MSVSLEQELVLELAAFRTPNKERILQLVGQRLDWAEVLGHLVYNRTAGIAYHVLRQISAPFFNREFEFGLYLLHQIQAERTKSHKTSILQLADALREGGIPHAFLKGSILANSIYPIGCRISSDIDILLRAEDLTRCGNILKGLGFIQGFHDENENVVVPATRREILNYRMNYGEVVPYRKVANEPGINLIEVDINFSLDWMAQGTEQAVDQFIENAEDYLFDGVHPVSALPKEYFIAHLCVHLFKEAAVLNWVEWQRDLGFYKFVDIYAFLTDPQLELDFEKLIDIMRTNNIVKECYYSLAHTLTFFPVLRENAGFMSMLAEIMPESTDYLEQVVDPADASVVYEWDKDLLTRFFDMKRFHLLKRIGDQEPVMN